MMNLENLKSEIEKNEKSYQDLDKTSFEQLATYIKSFSPIYSIFQTREKYKKTTNLILPLEQKEFFDKNDSELDNLSNRVLKIADAIDKEFNKFIKPNSPSLVGDFFSFLLNKDSSDRITSPDIYNSKMRQTSNTDPTSFESILTKYDTTDKNVALRRAASNGSVTDVELLITKFGADVNSKSPSNGFSALDWAFYKNQMNPQGVFNTLCWLQADQSTLKPLLAKYTLDSESEFPEKNLALARAMKRDNAQDIKVLVEKYKANPEEAQKILNNESSYNFK